MLKAPDLKKWFTQDGCDLKKAGTFGQSFKFFVFFIPDQAVAVIEAVLANLAVELVVAVRNVGVAEGVEPVELGVAPKKNRQAHPQHKR